MNLQKFTLMDKQNDADKHSGSEENYLVPEILDQEPGDKLSSKILNKWRNGVIICIRPSLFREDDDINMK
jgi:hypothetical protein